VSTAARLRLWLSIGVAVLAVLAVNAHLVYVSMSSQPACVAHVRSGEGTASSGIFSAAQSSCQPLKQRDP